MDRQPARSPLFPYTTLFRSTSSASAMGCPWKLPPESTSSPNTSGLSVAALSSVATSRSANANASPTAPRTCGVQRSEEHTSELQSHSDLVCRLLLEKKKAED